ncbi:ferredoxin [Streptomyces abyssomicinicus]|uniref:ferredoxin n=1 Tax=Streptomyces abyssomicinicus TaxID=574929 RepID=UPI001250124C|nr:ferredoxin [Streptomyces abyssomicinicus]
MKVAVDQGLCCGAGQCVLLAPEVFDQQDEDGLVVLLDPEPGARHAAAVREAAATCPTGAVQLVGES